MLNTNRIIEQFETVPEFGADMSRELFLDERRDIVTIRNYNTHPSHSSCLSPVSRPCPRCRAASLVTVFSWRLNINQGRSEATSQNIRDTIKTVAVETHNFHSLDSNNSKSFSPQTTFCWAQKTTRLVLKKSRRCSAKYRRSKLI